MIVASGGEDGNMLIWQVDPNAFEGWNPDPTTQRRSTGYDDQINRLSVYGVTKFADFHPGGAAVLFVGSVGANPSLTIA